MRKLLLSLLIISMANPSYASTLDLLNFGLGVAQKLASSPPLPSPEQDKKRKVTVLAAYTSSTIESSVFKYEADPEGYGVGVGYTSASVGNHSFFIYGVYSHAGGDYKEYPDSAALNDDVFGLADLSINSSILAVAWNYVFLGGLNSKVNMSFFVGPQMTMFEMSGDGDTIYSSNPATPVKDNHEVIKYDSYGPLVGLQTKMRLGKFVLIPYVLYYYDASDRCYSFSDNNLSGYQECDIINNSYSAFGFTAGWGNLKLNVYTKTNTHLSTDIDSINVYTLSYTFEF